MRFTLLTQTARPLPLNGKRHAFAHFLRADAHAIAHVVVKRTVQSGILFCDIRGESASSFELLLNIVSNALELVVAFALGCGLVGYGLRLIDHLRLLVGQVLLPLGVGHAFWVDFQVWQQRLVQGGARDAGGVVRSRYANVAASVDSLGDLRGNAWQLGAQFVRTDPRLIKRVHQRFALHPNFRQMPIVCYVLHKVVEGLRVVFAQLRFTGQFAQGLESGHALRCISGACGVLHDTRRHRWLAVREERGDAVRGDLHTRVHSRHKQRTIPSLIDGGPVLVGYAAIAIGAQDACGPAVAGHLLRRTGNAGLYGRAK